MAFAICSHKARSLLYFNMARGLCENPITGPAASPVSERPLKSAFSSLCVWKTAVFCDLHET